MFKRPQNEKCSTSLKTNQEEVLHLFYSAYAMFAFSLCKCLEKATHFLAEEKKYICNILEIYHVIMTHIGTNPVHTAYTVLLCLITRSLVFQYCCLHPIYFSDNRKKVDLYFSFSVVTLPMLFCRFME